MTIDLDKLEQLRANATVGDWETLSHGPSIEDSVITYSLWSNEYGDMLCGDISDRDADWVTAIHNAAPALIAELRAARQAVETQRKVAAAYLEALQDEYRPHIEQNKAFGLVITAQAEVIEQLQATIERGRKLAARWDCAAAMAPSGPVRNTTAAAARELRATMAVDPCGCTDLQALHDRSFGDYMKCVDCGTYYDTDGSKLS